MDRLRAVLPNGTVRDVADVYAWSRKQDWAVLEALADPGPQFAVASPESIHIGDRCFSIEGSPIGGRVLTELTITGQRSGSAPGGGGWLATVASEFATPGAPVMNEYGEVVGVIGTGLTGATRLPLIARLRAGLKGAPVVPLASFRVPDVVAPTPMTALRARGELVPALAREQNVLSGGFAHEIARTSTVAFSDQREEFSVREKTFVAFVSWAPVESLKGQTKLQLFDEENRLVLESTPKKINIGKRDMSLSSWEIPPAKLAPGTYRADVALDGKPIWRGFVKITP